MAVKGPGYDWRAIQAFYDAGHTAAEVQRSFAISNGAWYAAVQRGAVVVRARSANTYRVNTRGAVAELLAVGLSQAEIASRLGITRPTVCFHARKLGIPARSKLRQRYDWKAIADFYVQGHSANECRERFGFSLTAWADAIRRGDIVARPRLEALNDVLAAGRPRCRQHVKRRLLLAGLKTDGCEECGLNDWQGRPISFELHHVNGDGTDNRLENLRLLCPNCHSQTDTWGARNKGKRMAEPRDRRTLRAPW